jgi:hypothetical protein
MSASIASVSWRLNGAESPTQNELQQMESQRQRSTPQKWRPSGQGKQRLPRSRLCRVAPCRFCLLVGESVIEAHLCEAEQLSFGQAHCGDMLVLV